VLGGQTSAPCLHCAQVTIVELDSGRYHIEVRRNQRVASTTLRLGQANAIFDTARAIAVQTRLLAHLVPSSRSGDADIAARPSGRKPSGKEGDEQPARPVLTKTEPLVSPVAALPPNPVTPHPARSSAPAQPAAPVPVAATTPRDVVGRAAAVVPAKAGASKVRTSSSPEVKSDAKSHASSRPWWPWIPTVVGAGSAVGATVCAILSRERYDALSNQSRPLQQAVQLKSSGENWQTASIALSAAAAVGLTVGLVGFLSRSPRDHSVALTAGVFSDGGLIAVTGALP